LVATSFDGLSPAWEHLSQLAKQPEPDA
jgi:hypothetical protein